MNASPPDAVAAASLVPPCGGATDGGIEQCSASVLFFLDTWVSPPARPEPAPRDFTFKAVIGEPDW